jgi:tetratricopeptide (TPR) repeat protein/predicted Ser/Thr protein kinase
MKFKPGDSLGRYRIEVPLGAGGMGAVYRAHDTLLERRVAIKVLTSEGVNDVLREARSASALNHPNVCTVYEVGREGECAFIAMEYVEGRTLEGLIRQDPLSTTSSVDYAMQIADALSHAHEHGVIHADLKSANILVSSKNRIKIVDFGLSRRSEGSYDFATASTAVTTTVMAGTPYAMAPEQLRGVMPDMQSDVWSLGVVLFEMLVGTPPFSGTTLPELTSAILRDAAPPLPERIPVALRHVVERCLSKDTTLRFHNAGEVRAALETAVVAPHTPLHHERVPALGEWSIALPPAFADTDSSSVQLIGRDADLAALNSAMEKARAGRRQFVFVSGEAGIGKTRLISEFARLAAAENAVVLLGRSDAEALTPYQPFVEALEWYLRACPDAVVEAQLESVDSRSELAELVPGISRHFKTPAPVVESNAEGRRYRLFEAIASFFAAMSRRRPVLVVLEDIHWADRPTLLMLRHILRSSHEGAVLFIATYRETELDRAHPLADLLAELRREPSASSLKLRALNEREIATFLAGWLGHDAQKTLVELVAGNTEGNPLFISEVLRHLTETGKLDELQSGTKPRAGSFGLPEGIREVIGKRVSRLSDDCRRVLAFASVIGRDFALPVLQSVVEISEDRLLDILDEAQAAQLIHEAPGNVEGYTFTHALMRETLYSELSAARRVRLHRRVADVLEKRMHAGHEPLADLAYHYGQAASAGDVEKAVTYAVRAGEVASARFAAEEAARFYGMALNALAFLPDDAAVRERRLGLHIKSGKALATVGLWAAARAQFESALPLIPAAERERKAEMLVELAHCSHWLLDLPSLRRFATEAIQIADEIGKRDLWADAMAAMGSADNADGNVPKAIERDRQAIERAGGIRTITMARCVISLYHGGHTDETILRGEQAVASARESGDPGFLVYALSHLGLGRAAAGQYDEAQRAFAEARSVGRQYGTIPFLSRAIAMSAGTHLTLGNFGVAETLAQEARDLARQVAFAPPVVSAGVDLLFIHTRSGDIGRAEALLEEVGKAVRSTGGWHGWLWQLRLFQLLAELAYARGDWKTAVEEATKGITASHARARVKYEALSRTTRARARAKLGDRNGALEDVQAALVLARKLTDPPVLIEALSAHLEIDGSDALRAEATGVIERVGGRLSDPGLKKHFLDSASVRAVIK